MRPKQISASKPHSRMSHNRTDITTMQEGMHWHHGRSLGMVADAVAKSFIIYFISRFCLPFRRLMRSEPQPSSLTLSNSFSAFVAPRRFCSRADLSAMALWTVMGLLLAVGMVTLAVTTGKAVADTPCEKITNGDK